MVITPSLRMEAKVHGPFQEARGFPPPHVIHRFFALLLWVAASSGLWAVEAPHRLHCSSSGLSSEKSR